MRFLLHCTGFLFSSDVDLVRGCYSSHHWQSQQEAGEEGEVWSKEKASVPVLERGAVDMTSRDVI